MSIRHSSTIPTGIDEVFAWHTRPGAFQRLLPPWMPGRVRQEASSLADGRAELALPGGQIWVSQHDPDAYVAGRVFVDERVDHGARSVALAAVRWRHEHRFDPIALPSGEQGTLVRDNVDTMLGSHLLRPMFVYRHRQLADDLVRQRELAAPPMTVAVTGSSGLVGTALAAFLTTGGHRVIRLVRREAGEGERRWDPAEPAVDLLDGVDAVVHLAGASIFGRFDDEHRHRIRASRIGPTKRLAERAAASGVRAFVSASAIGWYGNDRGESSLAESSGAGDGFLADVVADWETESVAAADGGARVVQVRTGLVLSGRGGMLQVLRPIYQAGLGGPLASGTHWQSWIDLDDLVDIYARALVDAQLEGPVNAVAPDAVRQEQFAAELAGVLHRPSMMRTPALGPRVLLGQQGAQELALANQHVVPAKLASADHRFRRPRLEDALRHQLGRQQEAGR